MKLKYIIASLLAGVTLFSACEKEADHYLSEIKVDKSFVGFPKEGGSQTIVLTTTDAWTIEISEDDAAWLSASPASGAAGTQNVTLTAVAGEDGHNTSINIVCAGQKQIVKVSQEAGEKKEPAITPIADAIAAGAGSFRLQGLVTKVANTDYGNFYIEDETGSIYIYGVKDAKGYPKDDASGWARFGIEAGDKVVVEGPYKLYGDTPELVDAEVISVTKSLIDVAAFDFDKLPAIDTTFNMVVKAKESPLLLASDAEWLQIAGVNTDGSYKLHANENLKTAERTANITIQGPTAMKSVAITQKGVEATGSSVSEIIAMEDASMVKTLPTTVVVALTTKGAVLSDGTKAIYAFGDKAAALKVGDGVSVSAKKTTYNGVPELTDITDVFVDSEGNAVKHPDATDITAKAGEYTAAEAEYIKFSGTLAVSGNYYNITFDDIDAATKQGSIVYPVDELNAKSFDGKKITVTGYFNGLSSKGKYVNVIATKIAEYVDNPKGTLKNPYEASELAELLKAGTAIEGNVYARGIINKIDNVNLTYGNAQYWLSTDGTTADLEVYRGFWYGGENFTAEDQIKEGDEVVVYGAVKVYNGTAEFDAKNYIYTLNGKAAPAGDGTAENPYNVTKLAGMLLAGETVDGEVYAKGIISQIDNVNLSYGNAQYWISDDGGKLFQMEVYRGFWFNGDKFTSEDQIALGDEVVVYGKVKVYKETPEFDANNKIISLNGKTE